MAGFFGFFDYSKPGPGVNKDEPQKAPFFLFFELFFRKFWNLIKLNIMYFIFNIPALVWMIFWFVYFIDKSFDSDPLNDLLFKFFIGAIFILIPTVTVGPAQCGFTYILRNYARQEHAFLWWDFKENAKKNMKESLIITLIDWVIYVIMLVNFRFYSLSNGDIVMTIANGFFIIAFIVYMMMHMYIYPMLVTFKLSVKQVYKNALLFALMKFIPNLGILLICAVIVFATFSIGSILGILLLCVITYSLIGFITNFYVYPQLKKYMMDKAEMQTPIEPPKEA